MNIKNNLSLKGVALSKANAQIVAVTAAAAFITVFCLNAANYFEGIRSYQSKIIAADTTADQKLQSDVRAKNQLVRDYELFVNQNPNIIGTQDSSTPYIYNNATIILDALPSTYDYPATTSYLLKLLQSGNFDISSIGCNNNTSSSGGSSGSTSNPQPVQIPLNFSIQNINYNSVLTLFSMMQNSVMPLPIDNFTITGSNSNLNLSVTAHTYYQPAKKFEIGTETIAR